MKEFTQSKIKFGNSILKSNQEANSQIVTPKKTPLIKKIRSDSVNILKESISTNSLNRLAILNNSKKMTSETFRQSNQPMYKKISHVKHSNELPKEIIISMNHPKVKFKKKILSENSSVLNENFSNLSSLLDKYYLKAEEIQSTLKHNITTDKVLASKGKIQFEKIEEKEIEKPNLLSTYHFNEKPKTIDDKINEINEVFTSTFSKKKSTINEDGRIVQILNTKNPSIEKRLRNINLNTKNKLKMIETRTNEVDCKFRSISKSFYKEVNFDNTVFYKQPFVGFLCRKEKSPISHSIPDKFLAYEPLKAEYRRLKYVVNKQRLMQYSNWKCRRIDLIKDKLKGNEFTLDVIRSKVNNGYE